jgi:raffinose/stachyose/melibiose transport system substrate-binding protein
MSDSLSRRRFLLQSGKLAVGAGLAGTLLDACGGAGNTPPPTGLKIQLRDGKVTLWISPSTLGPSYDQFYKSHDVDAFNALKKGVTVDVVYKPLATIDQLTQTALAAGRGPDIVPGDGPSTGQRYASTGYLLDMSRYVKIFGWDAKILPWALETGLYKNKLYSLPTSYETMILFYNQTLFQKHGWTAPQNRHEFEAICEELAGNGITPLMAGNADWHPATEWFVTAFWNHYAGPDALYQALTGKLSWTDPVFVDGITLMNNYFQKGWFGGGVQKYFTNSFPPIETGLANEKYGMNIEGTWGFQEMGNYFGQNGKRDTYAWAPIPSLRDGVPYNLYALGVGSISCINAKAQDPDAAATYLDWLFSTPQRITAEMAANYTEPYPIHLTEADFPANLDKRFGQHYLDLASATATGVFGFTTWTFWPPKTDTYIYTNMDKVLVGNMTPAQFCAGHDQVFKEEFAKGLVPALPKPKGI